MSRWLEQKIVAGQRLTLEDGQYLLLHLPLDRLMALAHQERLRRHPTGVVTFVCDANPNYTNVCVARCTFCAFWRDQHAADAFCHDPASLVAHVAPVVEAGATTLLLQGGLHPDLGLADWLAMIHALQTAYPQLHLHPFSPPEIYFMAAKEGMTVTALLQRLWQEGLRTLPGGGGEVLVDRLRKRLSPKKCTATQWLAVMAAAHQVGFKTTATLVFGHLETPAEIIQHLLRLRALQDRTQGFSSFIPWSFKPGNTLLGGRRLPPVSPLRYVRIIATARLVLDNFPHIQSSWFGEGEILGQLGLMGGADDFGGLLLQERVLAETGHTPVMTRRRLCRLIKQMGFTPAERDAFYQVR